MSTPVYGEKVLPFYLEHVPARGCFVRLSAGLPHILTQANQIYPLPVAHLLSRLTVLAVGLSSFLKYKGVFSLQLKGDGPVNLMVVDVTSQGHTRGYARHGNLPQLEEEIGKDQILLGKGHLAFTVDEEGAKNPYQGIVAFDHGTLEEAVCTYLAQSEQISSYVCLSSGGQGDSLSASAMIVQQMPGSPETFPKPDLDWSYIGLLMRSLKDKEMLNRMLAYQDLLFHMFHEVGVCTSDSRPIVARCRCSRERLYKFLSQQSCEEQTKLAQNDEIRVTCEFCRRCYIFPLQELMNGQ